MKIGASKDEATIVIDPYENSTGLRFPRTLTADIVAVSEKHEHASNVEGVLGNPFVVKEPGEYEIKGIFVYGINAPRENTKGKEDRMVFKIAGEGMSIAHLGALDRPLTDEELSHFENVDILLLPVGGGEVLGPKNANEIIGQIEPKIVIPMFYSIPNIKMKLEPIGNFLKVMGSKDEALPRLKITQRDLPDEGVEVKVLSRD